MAGVLVLFVLVLPFVELAVFIAVAGKAGLLVTLGAIIAVGILGGVLAKRQGSSVYRRAQARLRSGETPTAEVVNGLLILAAATLLLLPGFVSDLLAVVLLVPPVRAAVRALLLRRFEQRVQGALAGPVEMAFGVGGVARVDVGRATYGAYDVREVVDDGPGAADRPGLERP